MDFRKVLDQTVRELKREVNKSILKVPEIEQKVLDATSNEPWGPHGTVMADIAQGTRNHYELQMIMAILWKRLSDTGRNWRHVYKALTVLEYLVAHGSERVIDEIREHVYQISTLSDFQYVESNGKDQGLNVRKKSQTLVTLVNDKEKIREVRQKAIENRDKYRGVSSTGGMYKPSSYNSMGGGYGDRYEEDSYSRYGRRDDDGYGRDRDVDGYREDGSYGREGDRSSRTGNQYRDEGYENDEDQYNSHRGGDRYNDKPRSYERDLDRAHNYTDPNLSRGAGGRNSDHGEDDKKGAEKQLTGPPSYEETSQSPEHHATRASESVVVQSATSNSITNKAPLVNNDLVEFDDFNPRASSAPLKLDDVFNQSEPSVAVRNLSPTPGLANVFGDVSDLFGETISSSVTTGPPPVNSYPVQHLAGDLFVDSPLQVEASGISTTASAQIAIKPLPSYSPPSINGLQPSVQPSSIAFVRQPPSHTTPNTGNEAVSAPSTFAPTTPLPPSQSANLSFGADGLFGVDSFNVLGAASSGAPQPALSLNTGMNPQPAIAGTLQANQPPPLSSSQPLFSGASQGQPLSSSTHTKPQQEKRFETKSAVWEDGFSKGLIDLNIGGPKTNSLADIGIDFDLLRTESVKEERIMSGKGVSNSKGKAMGSGSGLGMAGASAIVPPAAPAMMNNMRMPPHMGMGMGMGAGMGMGPPMMQMVMNPGLSMRPSMSRKAGMGGVPNQQQEYGGLR